MSKSFCIWYPSYLFDCLLFRFDLLVKVFSDINFLFLFSPVCISPTVCSFNSFSGLVVVGLYPFLSNVSGFSIAESPSPWSPISPSSLSDSVSDFFVRFWMICSFPSKISLKVPFHCVSYTVYSAYAVSVYKCYLVTDLRSPFFLLIVLKYNWSRNMFSVNQSSVFGSHGIFLSAYCGLYFRLKFPIK